MGNLDSPKTGQTPVSDCLTPAARWREQGRPDPHGSWYDRERAKLAGGDLSDDEVAHQTAVLMRNDMRHEAVLNIAKDRIRWLSRKLVAAQLEAKQREGELDELLAANGKLAAACCSAEQERGRLRAALQGLVRINEEHNEAISRIIGKPLNWKDDYLDEARAAIAAALPTTDPAPCGNSGETER